MIPKILSLTQIIAVISFFNVDSVISSNTYVSNLLKNHFHFKVMLSNIKNPDESREKRGNVRFHCQGRGEEHMYTWASNSKALTCLHLGQQAGSRRKDEAKAKLRSFEIH